MEIKSILVIGAGTMGSGIARCAAEHMVGVYLTDSDISIVHNAILKIKERLKKEIEKGEISEEKAGQILSTITPCSCPEDCQSADFVIEAIIEDIETKKNLFARIDKIFPSQVVLATNTSSLSITEIAKSTRNQERVIGMHFFNPVNKMKLVEIVTGEKTSQKSIEKTKQLAELLDKTAVFVKDSPGFIVNRLLIPMINEAICLLYGNVADRDSIDTAMKLGAGHPMGPLALADLIGLDICLHIMENLEKSLNDPKYQPCPLLRQMVSQHKLGRKIGEGFYLYK
ncbi:MAG TPA: 3-hydroxyacyl-CoA dehydrogenase NAD-binding domain-containing protein [bacterium]|nr:3-hydroxyacyl-CoA dehydrogenase NAD-binding domain-containing protein [bacterium]HOL35710.1 3-hydroxyacyl-CoA dehydrogenase NAD-binding domain-containing protein [bacterium]HPP09001.1 3-hydroxyacyl-CoA dehydrogenase NAD-binding domain-containing protein [bacterium]